jgi:hypothetical protein
LVACELEHGEAQVAEQRLNAGHVEVVEQRYVQQW